MASLIVTGGPAKDQKFALANHRLLMIGRDASASFQIIDPEMSRQHLQVRYDEKENRHYAIVRSTKNGVFINGDRIEEETLLSDRDVIKIGHSTLVYTTDDTLSAVQVHATWKQFGQGHINTMMPE